MISRERVGTEIGLMPGRIKKTFRDGKDNISSFQTSMSERTRRAVYWRLRAPGHADRWAACLSDAWHEYPTFRHALDRGGHQPIQAPR